MVLIQTPPHAPRRAGSGLVTVVIVLLIIGGSFLAWKLGGQHSGKLEDWHHDLASGIQAAEATGKPMLILFTADWCPPCRQLKSEVLTDSEVAAYLKKDYVTVKIDLTDRGSPNNSTAADFGVQFIPMMFITSADGQPIGSNGAMPKAPFMAWVQSSKSQLASQ